MDRERKIEIAVAILVALCIIASLVAVAVYEHKPATRVDRTAPGVATPVITISSGPVTGDATTAPTGFPADGR